MFCPECGTKFPDGSQFCRKCGNALRLPTTVATTAPISEKIQAVRPMSILTLVPMLALLGWFVLTVTAFAQTATKTKPQPALMKKPISKYMREVGLLYLEQIDDFQNEHVSDKDSSASNAWEDKWDRTFESLEGRITIAIDEHGRPAGDQPFFKLLKDTKTATKLYLMTGEKSRNFPMWQSISIGCQVRAHADALDGIYSSADSRCEEELDKGLHCAASIASQPCSVPFTSMAPVEGFEKPGGEPIPPDSKEEAARKREAAANSWHVQSYCEKDGFVWKDGVCHAQK